MGVGGGWSVVKLAIWLKVDNSGVVPRDQLPSGDWMGLNNITQDQGGIFGWYVRVL
jgi:hypothetical protein